jgi:hypothetical protein
MLSGGPGNDYLFADTLLSANGTGIIVPDMAGQSDRIEGGGGVDNAAQLGSDLIIGITGMLLDGGGRKSVLTWLRAQFMQLSPENLDELIEIALFRDNPADSPKQGLADLGCGDLIEIGSPVFAAPAVPQALVGEDELEDDGESDAAAFDMVFASVDNWGPGSR